MFADRYAVDTLTVYSVVKDKYGQTTVTEIGDVRCEFDEGGKLQRDEDGNEFLPMSTFYPVASSIEYKVGMSIALNGGRKEIIRKVSASSAGYFNRPDETVIYTG